MEKATLRSSDSLGAVYSSYHVDHQSFTEFSPVDKTATIAVDYFQSAVTVESRLKQKLIKIDPGLVGESRWGTSGFNIFTWFANIFSGWWNSATAAPLQRDWEILHAVTRETAPTPELFETLKRYDTSQDYEKEYLKTLVFRAYRIAPTKLERAYPPVGRMDTMGGNRNGKTQETLSSALHEYAGKNGIELPTSGYRILSDQVATIFPHLEGLCPYGRHPYGNSFQDHEILRIHPPVHQEKFHGVPVQFTAHGKPIIQQQATRGCTAGVTAMLIYEQTGKFNSSELAMRNLGTDSTIEFDFHQARVPFVSTKCSSLEDLQARIEEHGSAIVTVNSIGGHVVLVDEVTDTSVRIRDPYHGWEVDVKRSAFEASWSKGNTVFQVDQK